MLRHTLLTAASLTALAAPVHAQWAVIDPAHIAVSSAGLAEWVAQTANQAKSLANEARSLYNQGAQIAYDVRKLEQLVRTADAMIHGNIYAAADLIPQLQDLGLVDPWDENAAALQDLFTGMTDLAGVASSIAGEASALRDGFQFYRPAGAHYGALSLNGMANSSAVHMAAANRMMKAAQERARRINGLKGRVGSASDVTDAVNAGARVGLETATNTAQTNMVLTAMSNQWAQRDIREVQARAAWAASVDQLRADAEAAYVNAKAGQVSFQTGTGIRRINFVVPSSAVDGAEATALVSDSAGNMAPSSGSADAAGLMASREWGSVAAQAASSRGITAEALSSYCSIESNCTDVGRRVGSTIEGPWQVKASTGEAAAARAGLSAYNNSDPAQQAVAAAEEMRSIGSKLQNAGIQPTALNVRAGYQFGAAYAVSLNTATPDTPMASVLTSYSAEVLRANGVSNMTVGQWRASVAGRLGAGANKNIFAETRT